MSMTPDFLQDRCLRLLLFGGKGGAGKTTCAAAAALRLARRNPGRRYRLVSTDPAHSLADSLGDVALPANLAVEELDAGAALAEFRAAHRSRLREIASRGTFLSDEQIRSLLELSLPGLDELMAFLRIAEQAAGGDWDCVLVDTAPTGHTIRLLEIPDLVGGWLAALDALLAKHRYMRQAFAGSTAPDHLDDFLRDLAGRIEDGKELLRNAAQCRFIPVLLAERLSIRETESLLEALARLRVAADEIVVNRIYPEHGCERCAALRRAQQREIARLPDRWARYRLCGLPVYPSEVRGATLESFWDGAQRVVPGREAGAAPATVIWRVEGAVSPPAPEVRLLIVGGKGGVGKTTIACAAALAATRADHDRRVLLCSADPAHSLGDCLGLEIGPRPVKVRGRLQAVEMDARAELGALKRRYAAGLDRFFGALLKQFDPVFDRQAMERLLDLAPPGLDEVMALCRMAQWLSAGEYQTVILDSAATGHLLRLLELPALAQDWLRVLFGILLDQEPVLEMSEFSGRLVEFSRQLKQLRKLLSDHRRTQLYAVTIPTWMAFEETKDLLAACDRLEIAVPALVVNLVTGAGDCALCGSQRRQEAEVIARMRGLLHGRRLTMIERSGESLDAALEAPGVFAGPGARSWAAS